LKQFEAANLQGHPGLPVISSYNTLRFVT